MSKEELIQQVIDIEWEMFHSVNGDDRTSCQNDHGTFNIMRRGQYEAWSENTVACYLEDISRAREAGRNLAREKYIWMMKSTDPAGFDKFKGELPELSAEKEELVAKLWERLLVQTERMREKYPFLALGGRVTQASEECGGWPSVETYQTSEWKTYSEKTLRSLTADFDEKEAQGIDMAFEIQKNTVLGLGYPSMDKAEEVMGKQILRAISNNGKCISCGD